MTLEKIFTALSMAFVGAVCLPAQNQVSLTVDATMDIYRAGGYDDGSDGIPPVVFSFPARAWRTLTFPSSGGGWSCQNGYPDYGADGETSGYCFDAGGPTSFPSIGPFSGYHLTDSVGSLVGVFLDDAFPAFPPPALRFYVTDNSEGGIQTDFQNLSPKLGQIFWIGDGLTATGIGGIQKFAVPPTATHLYLGYADNCRKPISHVPGCYGDNVGSLSVTVRLRDHVPDWVEPTPSAAPSARIVPGMAYDQATRSSVLFGGSSAFYPGSTYGDTWMWRSNRWTQLFPAASPPARASAGMAHDPSTGTVVLFGGADNTSGAIFGDTWTWDGITWTQQFPPVSPPARSARGSMVYDAATETILLFGGISTNNGDYGGVPLADTWEWNGRTKTWSQKFPSTSPSPRATALAALAYDASGKKCRALRRR